jgi:hypothetical protein
VNERRGYENCRRGENVTKLRGKKENNKPFGSGFSVGKGTCWE